VLIYFIVLLYNRNCITQNYPSFSQNTCQHEPLPDYSEGLPKQTRGKYTQQCYCNTTKAPFQTVSIVCNKRDFVIVVKYWRMQATCQTDHYYK